MYKSACSYKIISIKLTDNIKINNLFNVANIIFNYSTTQTQKGVKI